MSHGGAKVFNLGRMTRRLAARSLVLCLVASAVFMRNSRSIVRGKHAYYYFLFPRAHLAPPHSGQRHAGAR